MAKTVFIAGPITGVPDYYKPFEAAMDEIQAAGMIPLNPCWQPQGLSREQYTKICLAMLGCADAALFLPGWSKSRGSLVEIAYCENANKPTVRLQNMAELSERVKGLAWILKGGEDE